MLEKILSYFVLYGIQNNVVIMNGAGPLEFQREKMYKGFRYLNALFIIFGIAIVGFLNYLLHTFVYNKIDMSFISFSIVVILAGLYNVLIGLLYKKSFKFYFYLYEKSYSFAFDLVYMISTVMMLDYNVAMLDFAISLLVVAVIVMVMNVLIGFFVRMLNRGYMNYNFRSVPSRLFMFAIFAILIYFAELLV